MLQRLLTGPRFLSRFAAELAVDLGTANTLIAASGEGVVLNEPSVVAVDAQTRRILSGGCAVGHLARQMQGRTPEGIDVVRPLAHGVIRDFQMCEAMLGYFLRKAADGSWRGRPRVLVGVPGCITPVEKRALYNSTLRAGARQVFLLPEAKAAAIGAGLPVVEPVASMVCDVGGGTTEVAVMSVGDIVAGSSVRTGGDDMDRAVVAYLRQHYSLKVGIAAAEQLRLEIGSAHPLEEELSAEVRGVDVHSGLPRKSSLTSEEIREALEDPLERIVEAIKETLDGCPAELAADLVDNGLVLTGGGALTRGLDRYLEARTGMPARVAPDPLTTVARGALICLEQLTRWRAVLESSDDDV